MIENALQLVHAAAEPTPLVPAGDSFAKLWLSFMPKEKTVTVHGVRIVLESFDSVPNSIEATLPDHTTYSLQEHHHVDDSYRIRKLGHRVNFPLIFGRVPARTMLSRFLQTIVEDWKQHQVQAAAEPERAWDLVPELVVYI